MTGSIARIAAPAALGVGLVTGGIATAMSLQPTISPRSGKQQAIVTGVSAVGGMAVGAGVTKLATKLGARIPGGPVALIGAMALGGIGVAAMTNRGAGTHAKAVSALGSAGTVLGAVGAAGLAVVGSRYLGPTAGKVALAAGVGGLAWKMHSQSDASPDAPTRTVAAAKIAAKRVAHRPIDASVPPVLATESGGRRSMFSMDEIGKEGRHFVEGVVPGAKIRKVMGGCAVDPIRVYAPLGSADTAQGRVNLAMHEAERLGTFNGSRKQIIVATTTGSGFVDPPSIQAAELMERGRTATIALQYANKPSVLSTGKVPLGGQTTKLMLEALHKRIAKMPPSQRPEVVMFGESLGAWAQQDAIKGTGTAELKKLGVSRSLWVGSPNGSTYAQEQKAGEINGSVRRFDRIEDVDKLTPKQRAQMKYVMLTHEDDPVAQMDPKSIGYQRPQWLPAHGTRPNGVPQAQKYVPGVSLAQGIVDLLNGTNPLPGKFDAHSHDYRADLPDFVRVAYGHDTPGTADYVNNRQVGAITSELVQMEKNRAALMQRDPSW
ncbi:MAG: alpha/beta-hydrolase family protein [Gaiellales bacterium]